MQNKDKAYLFSVLFVLALFPALEYVINLDKLRVRDEVIFFFCIAIGGVLYKALLALLNRYHE
jgi:hypothetical protein